MNTITNMKCNYCNFITNSFRPKQSLATHTWRKHPIPECSHHVTCINQGYPDPYLHSEPTNLVDTSSKVVEPWEERFEKLFPRIALRTDKSIKFLVEADFFELKQFISKEFDTLATEVREDCIQEMIVETDKIFKSKHSPGVVILKLRQMFEQLQSQGEEYQNK